MDSVRASRQAPSAIAIPIRPVRFSASSFLMASSAPVIEQGGLPKREGLGRPGRYAGCYLKKLLYKTMELMTRARERNACASHGFSPEGPPRFSILRLGTSLKSLQ